MADDFYTQWLGVKPGARPPDHYSLLGLPPFTHTPRAIEAGARAQLDKLDQYAISPDKAKRDAATRMMNEVAAARMTLSDPLRRDPYDQQLAAQLGVAVPKDDEMGETVVGGAAVMSSALDIGNITEETATPGGPGAPREELADEVFESNAGPLQDMDDYRAGRRHATIPFGVAVLIGVLALLLVVGVVILVAVGVSGSGDAVDPPPSEPVATIPRPAAPLNPPVVVDFDGVALPDNFDIRRGSPVVTGGMLHFDAEDGQVVAVEMTPKQELRLFREATATMTIQPEARVTFGIANAARLSLMRGEATMEYRAQPGRRVYDDSGEIATIEDAEQVTVRLHRFDGSVNWYVNEQHVAVSPDISTRGIPAILIEAAGPPGKRVAVDRIEVKYDPK